MYCLENYKTKKALKEAISRDDRVEVYQPGMLGSDPPQNGKVALEGPHYPESHTWYAMATLENGLVIKVS